MEVKTVSNKTTRTISLVTDYARIILGAAIWAIGIEWFFKPVGMVSGGITGVAMIINLITRFPIGVMMILFNIPIFIFALKTFGFKFMLSSIVGMLACSLFVDLYALTDTIMLTDDPLLAAIFGGIIMGFGTGMIYRTDATGGGAAVLAAAIRKKMPHVNFGTYLLFMDAVVIVAYALIFKNYEIAMYTVIAVFISAKVVDASLYGFSHSKLCHIITDHSDEIKTEIVKTLHRGVTVLRGTGAYSGLEKQVLLCVVKHKQIVEIRKIIKSIDQKAFVIVTDTRDVFGEGFEKLISGRRIG